MGYLLICSVAGVRSKPTCFVNGTICDVSFGVQALERTVEEGARITVVLSALPCRSRGLRIGSSAGCGR